ncbi:unnamed protein product [Larinioides sclopetarius]|uniref:Secreted protein n=1 Tax=Larinioides sclopetarius TaxID=280406 RepID=A0AAV1Z2N6_9ARAC
MRSSMFTRVHILILKLKCNQVALIVPACYCTFSRNLRCQPIVIPEEIHGFIDVCVAPAHIFISQNIASICICTYENIQ